LANTPALGEIQNGIAVSGNALHEVTTAGNPAAEQTIDIRPLAPPDLALNPFMTLSVQFHAATSDLGSFNAYTASLTLNGGPHPGYEILGFNLAGGNDRPRSVTGINVGLATFNGLNNNEPVPLAVGQTLAWDIWHSLTLVANQASDRYVSLTVDGMFEDLSAYALPRSDDGGTWKRGQFMEQVVAQVISNNGVLPGVDDHIYWDNLSVSVSPIPEPAVAWQLAAGLGLLGVAMVKRKRVRSS